MPQPEEFTQFRADVSAPSAEARERTRAAVGAAIEAELRGSCEPRVGRAGWRGSPSRRRPLRLVMAGVSVAATLTAAVALWPAGDGVRSGDGVIARLPPVIQQAYAALPSTGIYHTVADVRVVHTDLPEERYRSEQWEDAEDSRRAHQLHFDPSGRLTQELASVPVGAADGVGSRERLTIFSPGAGTIETMEQGFGEDPTEDEAERLRGFLREGLLRVAGHERLDGRGVIRLVGRAERESPNGSLVVLVDAETFLPVSVRESTPCLVSNGAGKCVPDEDGDLDGSTSYTRYRVFEVLPASPETLARLEMRPHPGATPVAE